MRSSLVLGLAVIALCTQAVSAIGIGFSADYGSRGSVGIWDEYHADENVAVSEKATAFNGAAMKDDREVEGSGSANLIQTAWGRGAGSDFVLGNVLHFENADHCVEKSSYKFAPFASEFSKTVTILGADEAASALTGEQRGNYVETASGVSDGDLRAYQKIGLGVNVFEASQTVTAKGDPAMAHTMAKDCHGNVALVYDSVSGNLEASHSANAFCPDIVPIDLATATKDSHLVGSSGKGGLMSINQYGIASIRTEFDDGIMRQQGYVRADDDVALCTASVLASGARVKQNVEANNIQGHYICSLEDQFWGVDVYHATAIASVDEDSALAAEPDDLVGDLDFCLP